MIKSIKEVTKGQWISIAGIVALLGLGSTAIGFSEDVDPYITTEEETRTMIAEVVDPINADVKSNTLAIQLPIYKTMKEKKCNGGGLNETEHLTFLKVIAKIDASVSEVDFTWKGCQVD